MYHGSTIDFFLLQADATCRCVEDLDRRAYEMLEPELFSDQHGSQLYLSLTPELDEECQVLME